MKAVTIHDAKTNLSKYIVAAKNGEKIYIGSFGKPQVLLSVIPDESQLAPKKRDFSKLKANIWASPDAFSKKTNKEIADLMLHVDDDLGA